MDNQLNSNQVEVQSLSREISSKSVLIARLQANLYKVAAENVKLKEKLKGKNKSKTKKDAAK